MKTHAELARSILKAKFDDIRERGVTSPPTGPQDLEKAITAALDAAYKRGAEEARAGMHTEECWKYVAKTVKNCGQYHCIAQCMNLPRALPALEEK